MIRWVICPVIQDVGGVFRPKVALLTDTGRPTYQDFDDPSITRTRSYSYSAVYGSVPPTVGDWCLAFVRGVNLASLDADPDVVDVLEDDYEDATADDVLGRTPADRGWSRSKINRIERRFRGQGVDSNQLGEDKMIREWLVSLGKLRDLRFNNPRAVWTGTARD